MDTKTNINELNLSYRTKTALRYNNIKTVEDIIKLSKISNLKTLKHIGKTSYKELKEYLIEHYNINIEEERYKELKDLGLSPKAINVLISKYGVYTLNSLLDLTTSRGYYNHMILDNRNKLEKEIIDKVHSLGYSFYDERTKISLSDRINILKIPYGQIRALNIIGIETIEDLLNISFNQNDKNNIYKARGIGPKAIQNIINLIHSNGLKFSCENDEQQSQKIKEIENQKKELLALKNKIINSSKPIDEYQSTYQRILEELINEGFSINDFGTQYITSLVTTYIQEKRLLIRLNCQDIEKSDYFNLSSKNNEHYSMFGTTKEEAINTMNNAIEKVYSDDITIVELANTLIEKEINKNYSKVLTKK